MAGIGIILYSSEATLATTENCEKARKDIDSCEQESANRGAGFRDKSVVR